MHMFRITYSGIQKLFNQCFKMVMMFVRDCSYFYTGTCNKKAKHLHSKTFI